MSRTKVILSFPTEGPTKCRATVVPVESARPAAMPASPGKAWIKRRLIAAMKVVVRLAEERASGADMRRALAKLDAKTFSEKLAQLAGRGGRGARSVTSADLDDLEEALGWVEAFVPGDGAKRLLLDWARGRSFTELACAYPEMGTGKATIWRRVDRAIDNILWGLRENKHKGLETVERNEV
ncbi:MAG: hypothetical protein HY055_12655 [Magnetospirillum sp.]|nr:hypothetical protein [Magnetospirillum sp.]